MPPTGMPSAAWVLGAAPSKVPFYVAGCLLAGWAFVLSATGVTHPEFPWSPRGQRAVIVLSILLVAAAMATAVLTASHEGAAAGAAHATPASPELRLAADPGGQLAYDHADVVVKSGKVPISFTNRSPLPHDVTIAQGSKVVAHTKVIQNGATSAVADLPAGDYVFYCSVDDHRAAGMQGKLAAR